MAFQYKPKSTFTTKIVVEKEGDKGKLEEVGSFTVEYKRPKQSEMEAWRDEVRADDSGQRVSDFLKEWVLGVSELTDENGAAIPPEKGKDVIIEDPELCALSFAAFFHGIKPARERANSAGNSRR